MRTDSAALVVQLSANRVRARSTSGITPARWRRGRHATRIVSGCLSVRPPCIGEDYDGVTAVLPHAALFREKVAAPFSWQSVRHAPGRRSGALGTIDLDRADKPALRRAAMDAAVADPGTTGTNSPLGEAWWVQRTTAGQCIRGLTSRAAVTDAIREARSGRSMTAPSFFPGMCVRLEGRDGHSSRRVRKGQEPTPWLLVQTQLRRKLPIAGVRCGKSVARGAGALVCVCTLRGACTLRHSRPQRSLRTPPSSDVTEVA